VSNDYEDPKVISIYYERGLTKVNIDLVKESTNPSTTFFKKNRWQTELADGVYCDKGKT